MLALGLPRYLSAEEEGAVCTCAHTCMYVCVSLNAQILLIQQPLLTPPPPPLYGEACRSPSQLLNLILSWREAAKGCREPAEKEFFPQDHPRNRLGGQFFLGGQLRVKCRDPHEPRLLDWKSGHLFPAVNAVHLDECDKTAS